MTKTNRRAYSNYTSPNELDIGCSSRRHQKKRSRRHRGHRHYHSSIPPARLQDLFESILNFLVSLIERDKKAFDYCSYHLVHNSERYDDDVRLEMGKMRKKVAIQMKELAFNGKDYTSVIYALPEFKRARDSLRTQAGVTVWLFREFMNGLALPAVKLQLTVLSNDANRHCTTITVYAKVVYHLSRWSVTDDVNARADEEIRDFKQGSQTP